MMPAITDQTRPIVNEARKGVISEVVRTFLIAVIIFTGLRLIVLPYKVDGVSMETTLANGELLLVGRPTYFHFDLNHVLNDIPFVHRHGTDIVYPFGYPQRGDIVILHPPKQVTAPYTVPTDTGQPFIKRIIGLPGDTVSLNDGRVYVNGKLLNEPYIHEPTYWPVGGTISSITVPPGDVFVMGDNRINSEDSRYFGPIPMNRLIGKVWITLWPANKFGIVTQPDYH